jgi:hypothetical protein
LILVLSLQVLSLKHGKSLFRWGGAGAPSQHCIGQNESIKLRVWLAEGMPIQNFGFLLEADKNLKAFNNKVRSLKF